MGQQTDVYAGGAPRNSNSSAPCKEQIGIMRFKTLDAVTEMT